ncbi:MAG: hypothetical protein U5L98_16405 [Halomonas sp.]|uniref:hypothetical protein n=1 Tax=Halomonas sp. TaxID=1486246 RepID=UPI002ACD8E39|nr:hypothetical protein [Halomonas sp.]MDZ7854165.1 hypothetical protein [Halomonas sp.]
MPLASIQDEALGSLSQARVDLDVVPPWSNLKKATFAQLDDGAGTDVDVLLSEVDGELGTREDLLNDDSRRRGYLCCLFPQGQSLPPVASYVLTRLLPLANGYSGCAYSGERDRSFRRS